MDRIRATEIAQSAAILTNFLLVFRNDELPPLNADAEDYAGHVEVHDDDWLF